MALAKAMFVSPARLKRLRPAAGALMRPADTPFVTAFPPALSSLCRLLVTFSAFAATYG